MSEDATGPTGPTGPAGAGAGTSTGERPPRRGPWWRDRRRTDRAALVGFAVLGVGGILLAGLLQLAEGDQRVLVVTMERDVGQEARERVKEACGDLPGVTVVADRGEDDPVKQGRMPVRFAIGGASIQQEAALDACLQQHDDVVRGLFREG